MAYPKYEISVWNGGRRYCSFLVDATGIPDDCRPNEPQLRTKLERHGLRLSKQPIAWEISQHLQPLASQFSDYVYALKSVSALEFLIEQHNECGKIRIFYQPPELRLASKVFKPMLFVPDADGFSVTAFPYVKWEYPYSDTLFARRDYVMTPTEIASVRAEIALRKNSERSALERAELEAAHRQRLETAPIDTVTQLARIADRLEALEKAVRRMQKGGSDGR
jgi:hypothetical protein